MPWTWKRSRYARFFDRCSMFNLQSMHRQSKKSRVSSLGATNHYELINTRLKFVLRTVGEPGESAIGALSATASVTHRSASSKCPVGAPMDRDNRMTELVSVSCCKSLHPSILAG